MEFKMELSETLWNDRHRHGDETLEGTFRRVAKALADTPEEEQEFFDVMDKGLFFPAGRTMTNAGLGKAVTNANCFNLNIVPDSMDDIFEMVKTGALTQKAGGGTGYNFSALRPEGTPTSNEGRASGPVSFMQVFDAATNTILQGE